ncbi:MAG: type II toxin-antitoxin system RelE/ParE family toxin [Nitrosomonadales bacterium]|nr:type II toxin-antitoxin system RelE/ParE family toxin [Nitrosomonadales bacterium]
MARKAIVKLTANFERNLEAIEVFLVKVDAAQAYDRLLDELSDTLIPNLEHFPALGRSFLERPVCSVEVANALARLQSKLHDGELREYLFADYLVLYAQFGDVIYLLSIKHHRELSFDFQSLWSRN